MITAIEKLSKILNLEKQRDYDNRSVFGGIEKILPSWKKEALFQNLSPDFINIVIEKIEIYNNSSLEERIKIIESIQRLIDRNFNIAKKSEENFKEEQPPSQELKSEPIPKNENSNNAILTKNSNIFEIEKALSKPVINVHGIGNNKAESLSRLGIFSIKDLIYFFPRRHEDYSVVKQINQLNFGETVSVVGVVKNIHTRKFKSGKQSITEIVIDDGTGNLRMIFFNQPFIERSIKQNKKIISSGKIEIYLGRFVMNNPEWAEVEQGGINPNRLFPYYPLTKSITQKWLRSIIYKQLNIWVPKVHEFFSQEFLEKANLIDLQSALLNVHFPENEELKRKAEERFSFQDTFFLHLAMLQQKKDWQNIEAKRIQIDKNLLSDLFTKIPYTLTNAQNNTIKEIAEDLTNGRPMSRLIQGDVGSGKTIIASIIIAGVVKSGYQSAVMAPTGILADQLHSNIKNFLISNKLIKENEICFLSGDSNDKQREIIKSGLLDGTIKVAIGTHALLEEPVQFKNLEFVVIDEQHRFGVLQRKKIREKGKTSHLLVMSATPIPRSLALTIFGDLDLSIIDEIPPGRKQVKTSIVNPTHREEIYALIRNQINQGLQAFIVFPLVEIDDPDSDETKAAVNEFKHLKSEIFPNLRMGLLHGRMKAEDKEKTMQAFRLKKFDILVSTTVIEVGVDIPNASIMVIEGANRFGLSQLHQLRGRVGRGEVQSYCILVPENEDALENERLKAMVATNDGFKLAEIDLQQRGPGDFIGTRQSGFKEIRFSTIMDARLIDKARKFAKDVLENDPNLINVNSYFYKLLMSEYWQKMTGVKN